MSTEAQQYDEKYKIEEWNRSIPAAGYIKLGSLRYGIRLSKINSISASNKSNNIDDNADNQSANKQQQQITLPISTPTSLIMSPSSDTTTAAAINGKSDFCNESCCCCISSSSSNAFTGKNISHNSQLSTMSAKNRTASSPSSASSSSSQKLLLKQQQHQQQQKSEQSKISSSVSSSNFKREASPTVCCYYIQNRSQSSRNNNCNSSKSVEINSDNINRTKKVPLLKEKIKKFEKSENLVEVVASGIPSSSSSLNNCDRRPVYKCVSENNNKRIYDDDKNSNFSTFLINRDERQQQQQLKAKAIQRGEAQKFIAQNERCKLKYVNDSNNNQVKSELVRNIQNCASSLPIRHKHDTQISKSDDIKITRVIIRHLEPTSSPSSPSLPNDQVSKQKVKNLLDDNDFSFIDSSSQSVSRSSSTSFASDEIALNDNYNLRKLRIPKISNRINNNNYKQQQELRTSANHIYSNDHSLYNNDFNCLSVLNKNRINLLSENEQQQQEHHQSYLEVRTDQTITIPENSTIMEKSKRNTLQKFGFGRKQPSSSASSSPERNRKTTSSKTERLKELTEKLKGHKTGSFKFNSRSVSPPVVTIPTPPPLPQTAPIPPPRKFKRSSHDTSAASSTDNLENSAVMEHHPDLQHIGKSKSVEPSSLLSGQITRQLARFLRPNTSASNLESLNRSKDTTQNNNEDDFLPKFNKAESRTIVGSYMQRSIPFRSASFSQADFNSGKYVKPELKSTIRHASIERSPSPPAKESTPERQIMKSEIQLELEDLFEPNEQSSKRNSDIETITEEPAAERLAEQHSIEDQLNVVQALETLIEEEPPLISVSPKTQRNEQLQQATTCLIPIPVFECIDKEWTNLPEHEGEEFCHPISEDVLPQAKVIENFIQILHNQETPCESSFEKQDSTESTQPQYIIPEVELNNVALQLDEITEKLKDEILPHEEVCNIVKTQIPQSKEELVPQKSFESVEEIRISPEIQEVLETVAETLHEEHKFLTNAIGNANINIVNLICPDLELSSDRGTPESSKFDLLKAMESSPEPGSFDKSSFDKSDNEFPEMTVRKRHSNDGNSGSDKSSPNASPNCNVDDKRKLDKSRRRKGIYIQWPAIERSQDTSFEYSANEDVYAPTKQQSLPTDSIGKKKGRGLEFCFSEPSIKHQSESIGSEPYTPESEHSAPKHPMWPKSSRRQSLTYQSSDEHDDQNSITLSPPVKQHRNVFQRSDSISDNESDRGSSRDRISSSPAPNNDQDLKRYSKRPLRGPYGQMLEAEMKKPTKVHYDGILEELCRSDSIKKSNCSLDSTGSSGGGFFSRNLKSRKAGSASLPVPMHQRAGSSPVPLIETPSPDPLPNHKKYPSSIDQRIVDSSDHLSFKSDSGSTKKLSLDSHLSVDQKSPKRTSSDISDKHTKKVYGDKVHLQKRSFDEIRMPATPEKNFILNTPETPKNMAATPELLAELLKGSSEKILNEQTTQNKKHQLRNNENSGSSNLPLAVLNSLNNLDTRTHVVVELFNTEKSYVESLQTIVLKYLNPLKLPENSGIVDIQTVDEIFFMVPSILNIHEKYLEELKKRLDAWDAMQCIGDVYYDVFSKPIVLETYIAFVNNWNKAKDAIRTTKSTKPAFAKFLEAMAREHKGKLSLDNLLIKPVQKFPNYELIFQRLIKHTDADHPDLPGCQDALKLVHDILVQLNCKEREALENGQREATLRELENVIEGISDLVSSERAFVSFELVSMPSGQAGRKERGFFLFTDLLVITSIKKRSGTYRKPNSMPGSFSTLDTNKYKFLTKIPLDDLEIVKCKLNLKKYIFIYVVLIYSVTPTM
ncbi:hypothetical protein PVAND_010136 [Polypedilum vanderplanki]|uniref:DH domain-containing protein n=1 Tax=Polypedilum vanderplanki TaxID=319348 RepID=A0A9J6CEU1_POLVA|nr:hypothetical protein PVAND_010136 [Polypedilum vanderplanki]